MNYFITRNGQEYGPYTLADLQRYVATGSILVTDMTRSEGMTEWVPVSQVIGNIPVPVAPQGPPASAGTWYPNPPNLHWGIAVLLAVITCGLFGWIWVFVQAAWIHKVRPESKCMIYVGIAIGLFFASGVLSVNKESAPLSALMNLAGAVMWQVGAFTMRSDIEEHYNSAEPLAIRLSGAMTFFFSIYYFQFHFTRINEMKRQGQFVVPQGT
ncbi:MAG TPA: DUF4339 domain-containing protein [Terriglobales bacterium]|jgi:hypothetical protein|nr:DUF4339 domain-containing protein [Terriglobales bacterium]